MKKGIIIFSRMDSSRLSSKAVVDLNGRNLLQRVIDRAKQVVNADEIILATSNREIDYPLRDIAQNEEISFFLGSLENVAERAYQCAAEKNLEYFARVCGDRPFICPNLISEYFDWCEEESLDLATNILGGSFPPGLTTEIIRNSALERILDLTNDPYDLEHLTNYFYNNLGNFKVGNRNCYNDWKNVSLVIDNEDDLKRARYIFNKLGDNPELESIPNIIELAREWYQKEDHYD
tara:strand:- start:6 stop:710 length:705 start_codon:yes stop_codon:yes gene_type:complete